VDRVFWVWLSPVSGEQRRGAIRGKATAGVGAAVQKLMGICFLRARMYWALRG